MTFNKHANFKWGMIAGIFDAVNYDVNTAGAIKKRWKSVSNIKPLEEIAKGIFSIIRYFFLIIYQEKPSGQIPYSGKTNRRRVMDEICRWHNFKGTTPENPRGMEAFVDFEKLFLLFSTNRSPKKIKIIEF